MIRPGSRIRNHSNPAGRDPALSLKRKADRICSLIVASDYPDIDIEIEIHNLRRWCEEHLPDRLALFDLVYVARFRRLREQFRS